jgi:hypothetical protein
MFNKINEVQIGEHWNTGGGTKKDLRWSLVRNWNNEYRYFIDDAHCKKLQVLFKIIHDSKNTVNKGDKIYASKASELPRFKLKEFIKENGLKKTSRLNQADVVIINRGYFTDLLKEFRYKEYTFLNTDVVLSKIDMKSTDKDVYAHFTDLIKQSTDKKMVALVSQYSSKEMEEKLGKLYPNEKIIYDSASYKIKGAHINLYRNFRLQNLIMVVSEMEQNIINGKVKIVFDEDMFVELNKEGVELDDEYLVTLRDMLFSKDESNNKLGFEMMSNLVVDQHMLLSISFLLNELIHTTSFRPSYYTNSNTNLKSLFKLLRTKGIFWERDWKTFGTGLRNNFKDGKEGDIVKKFLLDNINREFRLSNSAAESLIDIVFTTEAK